MKRLIGVLTLGLGVAMIGQVAVANTATTAAAATVKKSAHVKKTRARKQKKTAAAKVKKNEELQTDVKFNDSVLHGQYQVPEEALAKVENEKALSDLIGVRKHFKDRLAVSADEQ